MTKIKSFFNPLVHFKFLIKWFLLAIPVSLLVGSLVALFLWLLDGVTAIRWQYHWLLYFLPIAGVVIYFIYKFYGKNSAAGNNLIINEIHKPSKQGVPWQMAPLVFLTTLITHLFGGSAGREGTAVQISGSMVNVLGRLFNLNQKDVKLLLITGIAAGFGAVFGTPIAGAIFAIEVLAIGKLKYNAFIPCLIASVFSNYVCSAWGIQHTLYQINFTTTVSQWFSFLNLLLLLKVIIAGIAFGLVGFLFSEASHKVKNMFNNYVSTKWLIPVLGGIITIVLTFIVGTEEYLGLGVTSKTPGGTSIVSAFEAGGASNWSWFWKLLFTVIILSTGFKGGEVTPLFFIGATLGNTIAVILDAPIDLFAGIGLIAVFSGATNTPLACTLMGIELFGINNAVYFIIACYVAYYISGNSSIYQAQKTSAAKKKTLVHFLKQPKTD